MLSSEAPSAKPAFQSRSTSRMKPKVRARAISCGRSTGSRSSTFFWRPITRRVEIDLDLEAEAAGEGAELGEGAALLDANGLQNLDDSGGWRTGATTPAWSMRVDEGERRCRP